MPARFGWNEKQTEVYGFVHSSSATTAQSIIWSLLVRSDAAAGSIPHLSSPYFS